MSVKLSLIEQLRAIAGVAAGTKRFELQYASRRFGVVFTPGSSDALEISTPFPGPEAGARRPAGFRGVALPLAATRPLEISLSKEDQRRARAKERGINREVQIGDQVFDEQVYINSPSEDDIIKAVLGSPEARSVILELLERDAFVIVIDDEKGNVVVHVTEFAQMNPDQERAGRMLDAMSSLVSMLPSVTATPGRRPPDVGALLMAGMGIVGVLGIMGTPILYVHLSPEKCLKERTEDTVVVCDPDPACCTPAYVGLGAGGLLAALLAAFFFFTIRGRSNSLSRMTFAILSTTVFLVEASVIVARLVW